MPVAPGEDVMERDEEGRFVWLVVSEVVPLVSAGDDKPANVTRNVERWCASGVLAPYSHKASHEQILVLCRPPSRASPQEERRLPHPPRRTRAH